MFISLARKGWHILQTFLSNSSAWRDFDSSVRCYRCLSILSIFSTVLTISVCSLLAAIVYLASLRVACWLVLPLFRLPWMHYNSTQLHGIDGVWGIPLDDRDMPWNSKIGGMPYKERLLALNLLPLSYARETKELTFYKALYGLSDFNVSNFVSLISHM